jgi:hypothetical protein
MGGIFMKRRYDIAHAVILVLFLVIASFIGNALIKGILLLLFSAVLLFNTILTLKMKKNDKFTYKIFYGILLFLDSVLALGAIFVIVSSIVETF